MALKLNRNIWSLLALIPIASLFFIGGPDATVLPWFRHAWNLGHIVFFFVATLSVAAALPRFSCEIPWRYLAFIGVASLVIEAIQLVIGRSFSLLDVARNLTGASLALAYLLKASIPKSLLLIAVLFLLFDTSKFAQLATMDWNYQHRQPLIEDFESEKYLAYWPRHIERSQTDVLTGSYSGLVKLNPGKYSGIKVSPVLRDWSQYKSVQLAVFNSQSFERSITLRMHDITHEKSTQNFSDRFNKTLNLKPGWNQIEIPLSEIASAPESRAMDLTKMHQIEVFYSGLEQADYLILDDIRLTY